MSKFQIYVTSTIALILISYWCANALNDSVASTATTVWLAMWCLISGVLGLYAGVSAIMELCDHVR
jgi:hypothetical protein